MILNSRWRVKRHGGTSDSLNVGVGPIYENRLWHLKKNRKFYAGYEDLTLRIQRLKWLGYILEDG